MKDGYAEGYVKRAIPPPRTAIFSTGALSETAQNDIDIGSGAVQAAAFDDEFTTGEDNISATEDP